MKSSNAQDAVISEGGYYQVLHQKRDRAQALPALLAPYQQQTDMD